jgi:hypothetical protein
VVAGIARPLPAFCVDLRRVLRGLLPLPPCLARRVGQQRRLLETLGTANCCAPCPTSITLGVFSITARATETDARCPPTRPPHRSGRRHP